jgi:hypothetical protein
VIALPNRLPVVFCWVYAAQRGASSGARTNVSSCMGCGTGSSFTAAVTLCVAWHVSTLHATQRRRYERAGVLKGYSKGTQRGTQGVLKGVLKGYSRGTPGARTWGMLAPQVRGRRGTQGVLKGYSRGTPGART